MFFKSTASSTWSAFEMLKSSFLLIDFMTRYGPDLHASMFELTGTILFLLFAFNSCQTASMVHSRDSNVNSPTGAGPSVPELEYCSKAFGISLLVTIALFLRVTGGVFNPAVCLALFLTRGITLIRFILYCIAQLVGSIVAAALLQALHPGKTAVNTALNPSVSYARGIFIEAFATFLLVLSVLITATDKRTLASKRHAPFIIAASLWLGHLWAIEYTGAGINPARSFGPSVIEGFNKDHWVYWVGPIIGSLFATAFYTYLQFTKYWMLGNCYDHQEDQPKDDIGHKPLLPMFQETHNQQTEAPHSEPMNSSDGSSSTLGTSSSDLMVTEPKAQV